MKKDVGLPMAKKERKQGRSFLMLAHSVTETTSARNALLQFYCNRMGFFFTPTVVTKSSNLTVFFANIFLLTSL